MLDLDKREKLIIIFLLVALLIGLLFGICQKRAVRVNVDSSGFDLSVKEETSLNNPKININKSNSIELMKLKGVGRVLADRIVEYRLKNGNFIMVDDLKKVKGVGQKLYDRIKDEVCVD